MQQTSKKTACFAPLFPHPFNELNVIQRRLKRNCNTATLLMAQTLCRRAELLGSGAKLRTRHAKLWFHYHCFSASIFRQAKGGHRRKSRNSGAQTQPQRFSKKSSAWPRRARPIEPRVVELGTREFTPQIHYHKYGQQKVTPPLIGTVLTNTEELSQI